MCEDGCSYAKCAREIVEAELMLRQQEPPWFELLLSALQEICLNEPCVFNHGEIETPTLF